MNQTPLHHRSIIATAATSHRLPSFLLSASRAFSWTANVDEAAATSHRLPSFLLSAFRAFSWTANVFEEGSDGEGSAVYHHALKYSRPGTIDLRRDQASKHSRPSTMNLLRERMHLQNSVSLIGTVERPMTVYNPPKHRYGVYTLLRVKNSPESQSSFRIMAVMRDEMGELAMQHVRLNDYVFVSGHLESYSKADVHGNSKLYHKVIVKELNYVKQDARSHKVLDVENSDSQEGGDVESSSCSRRVTKQKEQLHLWQVYFANPYEWFDRRERKKSPRSPDFVHKDTGEALWINEDDPPWVRKQLELNDFRARGESRRVWSHLTHLLIE